MCSSVRVGPGVSGQALTVCEPRSVVYVGSRGFWVKSPVPFLCIDAAGNHVLFPSPLNLWGVRIFIWGAYEALTVSWALWIQQGTREPAFLVYLVGEVRQASRYKMLKSCRWKVSHKVKGWCFKGHTVSGR